MVDQAAADFVGCPVVRPLRRSFETDIALQAQFGEAQCALALFHERQPVAPAAKAQGDVPKRDLLLGLSGARIPRVSFPCSEGERVPWHHALTTDEVKHMKHYISLSVIPGSLFDCGWVSALERTIAPERTDPKINQDIRTSESAS